MPERETAGGQPDLAAEARFWRDWNTAVFERVHSREEAGKIAARLSPDPASIDALLAHARTASALRQPAARGDDVLIQIHADADRFFQSRLGGSWVPGYLVGRGLDAVLLPTSPWKIGYAPDSWTALTSHLRDLGYDDDTMLRSGLVAEGKNGRLRDRFRDRLMIPVRRAGDRVAIAFIGRRHPDATDGHGPKYLNSPNTELYIKGRTLPGLAEGRRSLDHGAQPVLVEGPMDAIAVSIAAPGAYVGVTACGTALTPDQAALLARTVNLRESGVRVALDPDSAGRKAAIRAYAPLSRVTAEITAVTLPGQDPADLLQSQGRQPLKDTLTASVRPLADLVVDARIEAWHHDGELKSIEAQFSAIRAAGKVIATMPPREAAGQASRIAALFITRYGWNSEEATRELTEAAQRHVPATRNGPTSAHSPTRGLPSQTTAILAKATVPPGNHTPPARHGQSQDLLRVHGQTRTQTGPSQRGDLV